MVLEQPGRPFATEVAPTGLAGYRGWLRVVLFCWGGWVSGVLGGVFFPGSAIGCQEFSQLVGFPPSPVGAVLTAKWEVVQGEGVVLE